MSLNFPRSIGDGYPEYTDDEVGYNYHAWEVISASESARHERIRFAEYDDLEALQQELAPLSDLERWALSRRHFENGDRDAYFATAQTVIDGDHQHRALHYPEIAVTLARHHAKSGAYDRAVELVALIEKTWPALVDALPLLNAQLLLRANRLDEADSAYDEVFKPYDDVDLLVEAAEDFEGVAAFDLARKWLDIAREAAQTQNDTASLVDIDLLAQSLPEPTTDENPAPID